MHIVDLYATLLGRAGIDPADGDSPAPIDSLDMWDWWSGASPVSPRTTAVLDHDMFNVSGNGVTGGESWRRRGKSHREDDDRWLCSLSALFLQQCARVATSCWWGPRKASGRPPGTDSSHPTRRRPSSTKTSTPAGARASGGAGSPMVCARPHPKSLPAFNSNAGTPPGCLFDLVADPTEHVDLAAALPDTFASLHEAFQAFNESYHPPVENPPLETKQFCAQVRSGVNTYAVSPCCLPLSPAAVQVAANGGVAGPWKSARHGGGSA